MNRGMRRTRSGGPTQTLITFVRSCVPEIALGASLLDGKPAFSEIAIRESERQRISRELHDSTSQLLVVLQLKLGELGRSGVPGTELLLHEITEIVRDVHRSIGHVRSTQKASEEDAEGASIAVARLFQSLGRLDQSA